MYGIAPAVTVSGKPGRPLLALMLTSMTLFSSHSANAQFGPLDIDGFLEYQYRQTDGTGQADGLAQLGTFRTHAATYLWRPWILQLNGSLGLTKTVADTAVAEQTSTLITGDFRMDLFRQSRFPFAVYVDKRDSRVNGELSGIDVQTKIFGFTQQYAVNGGGRYSLDYRRTTVDDLFEDSSRPSRQSANDSWQVSAFKTLGRNQFVLNSVLTDISQNEPNQSLDRVRHTLRHRFRSRHGFSLEDTAFFSNERFSTGDFTSERRFLQFNGVSTWRPKTSKPLVIVGRGLLQGTESGGEGFELGSTNLSLTVSATYQYSDRLTLAANAGFVVADADEAEESSSVFQRLRADYRSAIVDLGNNQYRWGGTLEAGNRSNSGEVAAVESQQDVILSFNHHLSRRLQMSTGRDFEVSVSQQLSGAADTENDGRQSATHTISSTLSRQLDQTRSFIRLSATDRRMFGEQRDVFQLLNLQASRSTQTSRYRSWNGSLTLQYGRTARQNGPQASDNQTISYSANLSYRHANLFNVSRMSFTSELHLLSSDFMSDDPFDNELESERSRTDTSWRNRLDYRVGLLQLRLEGNVREIDGVWNSMLFLSIRRYYGIR